MNYSGGAFCFVPTQEIIAASDSNASALTPTPAPFRRGVPGIRLLLKYRRFGKLGLGLKPIVQSRSFRTARLLPYCICALGYVKRPICAHSQFLSCDRPTCSLIRIFFARENVTGRRNLTMWKAAQVILWAPAASNLFHGSKDTLFRIHGTNQPERRSHFVGLHLHDQQGRDRSPPADEDRQADGGPLIKRAVIGQGGVAWAAPRPRVARWWQLTINSARTIAKMTGTLASPPAFLAVAYLSTCDGLFAGAVTFKAICRS
jgi:hypothetical protein